MTTTEPLPELSPQERRVLSLISYGLTYEAIAYELDRSVETIKTHSKNAYRALDVHNAAHAIGKCYRLRLFRPPPHAEPHPDLSAQPHEDGNHD